MALTRPSEPQTKVQEDPHKVSSGFKPSGVIGGIQLSLFKKTKVLYKKMNNVMSGEHKKVSCNRNEGIFLGTIK